MAQLVIVTGLPATGKTSIATELAARLRYPIFSKDTYKELLCDVLVAPDISWSKKFGGAAMEILWKNIELTLAADISLIIEANFSAGLHEQKLLPLIEKYRPNIVQILCHAEGEEVCRRFSERASKNRHPGHFDGDRQDELRPLLLQGRIEPLALRGRLLEIDTTDWSCVDLDAIHRTLE